MFKKVTKIALAGIIGVGTMVGSSSLVSAASEDYETNVNIKFKLNTEATLPVNPTNPEQEVTPNLDGGLSGSEDQKVLGKDGPLSIDYASHINFGELKISGKTQTYYANPITFDEEVDSSAPYVQVTDNRGSKTGWRLEVARDGQLTSGEDELNGAILSLNESKINTNSETELERNKEIVINNDTSNIVMEAESGEGAGTYTNVFGIIEKMEVEDEAKDIARNVTLEVPGDTKKVADGIYTTTLNWTLVDAAE